MLASCEDDAEYAPRNVLTNTLWKEITFENKTSTLTFSATTVTHKVVREEYDLAELKKVTTTTEHVYKYNSTSDPDIYMLYAQDKNQEDLKIRLTSNSSMIIFTQKTNEVFGSFNKEQ
ncbi:MAG: hypothetical protein HUK02_09175 [Bacteroidaceae bacterium]|nr:hypothetical protein [Bacteroidaceae bacterium]